MSTSTINGQELYELWLGAYRNLRQHEQYIDQLNVFPVPDGDTGANMAMTLSGGVSVGGEKESVTELMTAFSRGTLFSARGNSGVILSQFVRGMAKGTEGKDTLTLSDFAAAVRAGVDYAYKAVVRPVEGTVLTVMRETADFLEAHADEFLDFADCFSRCLPVMKNALAHTPDLLEVLKEAGVVDSGGAGFVCLFEGMMAAANGEELPEVSVAAPAGAGAPNGSFGRDSRLEYGYCTEFILQLMTYKTDIAAFDIQPMIAYLESVGDSVVAVADDDIVKVHVHTFTPEEVLAYARRFGEFVTIKIENMSVQHSEAAVPAPQKPKKHQTYAIVATASGKGISDYFCEIGTDVIVNGGQTQNPAAEDFINAFKQVDADYIIVLPNNSNIVMAAQQAAKLYTDADVRVIPTRSIAEGYSALSMMDTSADTVEELIEGMSAGLGGVSTGYVTTATRDTVMNGVTVQKGKYIGLDRENILCCCEDKLTAAMDMLKNLPDIEDKQTIIVFTGKDVTEDEAAELADAIESDYPLCDVGFIAGGQDVYSFIMSIE